MSVEQWRDELEKWTTINRKNIIRLTGKIADKWEPPGVCNMVVITTYAMLTKKRDKENPTIAIMK